MRSRVPMFAVLLITGFAVAAVAEPAAPSAADLAFIASLAEETAPAVPELEVPAPQQRTCSVSNECGDGNVATCTGNNSCTTTIAGVKCDGNEVKCPHFCTISQECQCCTGTQTGFCWSKRGDCEATPEGISCNDQVVRCEDTCPQCPDW